jgi:hypothetical protein
MNPISALKLLPKVIGAGKAIEAFIHADTELARIDAADRVVVTVLPVVEGFVGRDLVDDSKVRSAVPKLTSAIYAFLNVVRDVKAKQLAEVDVNGVVTNRD